MAQKLVPVTEEDKKKSYYKYYLHNIKEITNLAALLPRIYPEERDNF